MEKTCINCYTITINNKQTILNPGINIKDFELIPLKSSIVLQETPICRFAVEEQFKSLDRLCQSRWTVINKNHEKFFYRFFRDVTAEADNFIYLLLNYEDAKEMSRYLLSNAISIQRKKAIIRLKLEDYPLYFVFKNKNFTVSSSGVQMH